MKKKTKLISNSIVIILIFILLLIYSLSIQIAISQPQQEWVARYNSPENYDDYIQDMALDDSGNVYLTGYIYKSSIDQDFITIKYSSQGTFQWAKTYDGNDHREDKSYSIAVDDSGNVYVTGFTYSAQTLGDYLTIKYNSNGDSIWSRRYNNQFNRYDKAYKLVLDDSSNIFVTGESYFEGQSSNILTIKYDKNGNQKWIKTFNGNRNVYDRPYDIKVDIMGNIYVTGLASDTNGTLITIKYNKIGDTRWISHDNSKGAKVSIDEFFNVYVAGDYYNPNLHYDFNIIKYDSNGTKIWQRTYGNPNKADYLKDMVIDDSNDVFLTGLGASIGEMAWDYLTIKYNDNGDSLWIRRYNPVYNSEDRPYSIDIDKNGNVFVAGSSNYNFLGSKYTTVVYSKSGQQEYVLNYDNNYPYNNHEAIKVKVDDYNNIYVTGNSQGVGTGYDIATIKYSPVTKTTKQNNYIPKEFKLYQNYPNPFNSNTKIRFDISKAGIVELEVYDILGRKLQTLFKGYKTPGVYETDFDSRNLPSGIYYYILRKEGMLIDTKKLSFIK